MSSGIYVIENAISKSFYIGSAVNIKNRWCRHKSDLRSGYHKNPHLQNAWNKYGEIAFIFKIIEENIDKSCLIDKEQYYIDTLKPAYNACPNAGSHLGVKRSKETRRKMSEIRKGVPHPHSGGLLSEESKQKLSMSIKKWWLKKKSASLEVCLQ